MGRKKSVQKIAIPSRPSLNIGARDGRPWTSPRKKNQPPTSLIEANLIQVGQLPAEEDSEASPDPHSNGVDDLAGTRKEGVQLSIPVEDLEGEGEVFLPYVNISQKNSTLREQVSHCESPFSVDSYGQLSLFAFAQLSSLLPEVRTDYELEWSSRAPDDIDFIALDAMPDPGTVRVAMDRIATLPPTGVVNSIRIAPSRRQESLPPCMYLPVKAIRFWLDVNAVRESMERACRAKAWLEFRLHEDHPVAPPFIFKLIWRPLNSSKTFPADKS
jgi:hypothetical protein